MPRPKATEICLDEVYLKPEDERDLLQRLARIEGHVRGLQKMLAEHKSCDDLLVQLSAIKAALNQVSIRLLEGHMATCVAEAVERGEGVEALERLKGALGALLKGS